MLYVCIYLFLCVYLCLGMCSGVFISYNISQELSGSYFLRYEEYLCLSRRVVIEVFPNSIYNIAMFYIGKHFDSSLLQKEKSKKNIGIK